MHKIAPLAPAFAVGIVLAACAACAPAQSFQGPYVDMSTCRDVSTQVEIDGVPRPVVGRACLQADGNWVLVGTYEDWSGYPYVYGYSPWYWGGPVFVGGSVIVIDRFHHHHRFHPAGGFRPNVGMRPFGMGHGWQGRGGWNAGAGGGMRRH